MTYADNASAQQMGHFNNSGGKVYMGVDHTYPASGSGRMSVRMQSNKTYTHGLFILDLEHMPGSICGSWPAFWTTNTSNWPLDGEIDIIEGVNNQLTDSMTLHTGGPSCSINNEMTQLSSTSQILTANCDVNSAENVGCSINNTISTSYGTGFNANGGGIYAMEWTSAYIAIWSFPHAFAPADIASATPNPSNWPSPAALFQGPCNIDSSFRNHNIIFDTTFCGSWAGGTSWTTSGCAAAHGASCSTYVQNSPTDFAETYWMVNSLMVYQDNGDAAAAETVIPSASTFSVLSSTFALAVPDSSQTIKTDASSTSQLSPDITPSLMALTVTAAAITVSVIASNI